MLRLDLLVVGPAILTVAAVASDLPERRERVAVRYEGRYFFFAARPSSRTNTTSCQRSVSLGIFAS
jgi:hypothetical protein